MKLKKYLILNIMLLLSLALIDSKAFYAQNQIYPIINSSESYLLRCYIFSNYNSCFDCMNNFNNFLNQFKNSFNSDIEFVFFISEVDESLITKLKNDFNIKVKIIPDYLGAYYKEYKIDGNNTILVLNNSGELIFKEQIDNLTNKMILSAIEKQKNIQQIINSNYSVSIFNVQNGLNNIKTSRYTNGVYSKNEKIFYFPIDKKIYKTSKEGQVIDSVLIPFKNIYDSKNISINWYVENQILLLNYRGMNLNNYQDEITNILIDINTKEIKPLNFIPNNSLDKMNSCYLSKYDSTIIISSLNDTIYPLHAFKHNGMKISDFSEYSNNFEKFNIKSAYYDYCDFDTATIYSIQSFDNKIIKINNKFKIDTFITLKYSSNFKEVNTKLSKKAKNIDWIEFARNTSLLRGFKFNPNTKEFLVLYRNDSIPEGTTDSFSPLIKRNYYLELFDLAGNLLVDPIKLDCDFPQLINYDGDEALLVFNENSKLKICKIVFTKKEGKYEK